MSVAPSGRPPMVSGSASARSRRRSPPVPARRGRGSPSSPVPLEQAACVADWHRPAVEERVVEAPEAELACLARLHIGLELFDHVAPEEIGELVGGRRGVTLDLG